MMEFQNKLRFDAPPAPPRVVRVTSLEALAAIRKTLPMREAAVFEALELMVARRGRSMRPPTAYELLRDMQNRTNGEVFDLNSVRPRLTALKERGLVENGDKVVCSITRKKAFTWLPSQQVRDVQRSKAA